MATPFKQVADNAVSTTATSYAATGVTSTTAATGTGSKFPTPGNGFILTIWTGALGSDPGADANMEEVTVTARSGDVLTHSATTKTHASPVNIGALDVAQNTTDLQTAVNSIENGMLNSSLVSNEVPVGLVNGSNTAYTTASNMATGSLRVFRNGIRLKGGGVDFTQGSNNAFTMTTAPNTGDTLLVDYNVSATGFTVGTNSTISSEIPTGTINGTTTVFTTARAYIAGSLEVYVDGVHQRRTTDYTETTPSSGTFTFVSAPLTGQSVVCNYQFNLNPSSNADTVDGVHASTTGGQSGQLIADYGGWWLSSDALTFVTSTTATMPGDVTGRYQQGDKFKFDNSATKYFYLRALSYNSGTGLTTLTFYGGSGTTIANSSITNVYYSRVSNPFGFPAFMTDTNAGAAGGDINVEIIGKHIRMWGLTNSQSITNGAAVAFTITFPFTIASGARMVGQCADMTVSAASVTGQVSSSPTTTNGNGQVYNNSGSTITSKFTWAVDGSL